MLDYATPNMLVFVESESFLPKIAGNRQVSCVITTRKLAANVPETHGVGVSDYPRSAFYELHNHLTLNTDFYWTDFPSEISEEAMIAPNAYVADRSVRVGRGAVIEPGAIVLERSLIGQDVVLRAGCTVGSQGFGFARTGDSFLSEAHAGGVRLHDRVEVQANTVIDRALFGGFTEIGEDTKLGDLVRVGHHVRIGKRCLIAAATMIAGSVLIGDDVWIGPNATISNRIVIGDRAQVSLGSVVTRNVEPGQRVTGNLAIDHGRFIAFLKSIR
jgi:UDP-3-O-[3-hydroxymyristoyl] glucosamine N-acyltransferase